MESMYCDSKKFNYDLSICDVSCVKNMAGMF